MHTLGIFDSSIFLFSPFLFKCFFTLNPLSFVELKKSDFTKMELEYQKETHHITIQQMVAILDN